jgi:hypothetical protein
MAGVFSIDLGTLQGRIPSSYAAHGSYVYELGHANCIAERVKLGDYHEIKQNIVLDPEAGFLRVSVRIVPPTTLESGYSWKLTGKLNGVARVTRTISASNITKVLSDIAIPLALASSPPTPNEIAFRLELVT